MRLFTRAPAHIGHGSRVAYIVQPDSRHPPIRRAASRRARISACASGSPSNSRRLWPRPTTSPSRTTTAPTGTSPNSPARLASARASNIQRRSSCVSKTKPPPERNAYVTREAAERQAGGALHLDRGAFILAPGAFALGSGTLILGSGEFILAPGMLVLGSGVFILSPGVFI